MSEEKTLVTLQEGWSLLYTQGFIAVQSLLDRNIPSSFPNETYVKLYSCVMFSSVVECN